MGDGTRYSAFDIKAFLWHPRGLPVTLRFVRRCPGKWETRRDFGAGDREIEGVEQTKSFIEKVSREMRKFPGQDLKNQEPSRVEPREDCHHVLLCHSFTPLIAYGGVLLQDLASGVSSLIH